MSAVLVSFSAGAMKHERALARAEKESGGRLKDIKKPIKEYSAAGDIYDRATVIVRGIPGVEDRVKVSLLGEAKGNAMVVDRQNTSVETPAAPCLLRFFMLETVDRSEQFAHLAAQYFFYKQQKNELGGQKKAHVFDCFISQESRSRTCVEPQEFTCFMRPCLWALGKKQSPHMGTLTLDQEA